MLVTRRVREGREREFEAFLERLGEEAGALPGHQGMAVIRPSAGGREYAVVYRFDSAENLARWQGSPARAALIAGSAELAEEPPEERELAGMDAWFALPGGRVVRPPARWKMWLLSLCAVYPTITLLVTIAGPLLEHLALPLRFAIVAPTLTALMTWVLMPLLSRWSARWLYR
ncbi:antibiotic biosynthesis monooxygenase [Streptomyces sp. NPDC056883]|uniref:antibiotic biosynthesis monooxygenase n=1 Tax=Streptomyces sp. NPDC056883 TaxID=3345959 RepID=UPI0036D16A1C